jgi:hypothetical protein
LPLWVLKAKWIASRRGMILTLTHPDYCGQPAKIGLYEELLKHLADMDSVWRALPSEVVEWWQQRSRSCLRLEQGQPVIHGPAAERAVAEPLSEELLTA